jgi:subtilisin family serine protease
MSPIDPKDGPKHPEPGSSREPSAQAQEGGEVSRELQRRSKLSPHLRARAIDWERRRAEERDPGAQESDSAAAPLIKVLIELKRDDTSELKSTRIEFKHVFGLFYSAQVPLNRLEQLAELESVLHIHHEPNLKPTLDDSIPEIRANGVRNPQFPFSGTNKFTGVGVIIGIIDSGINILHPVFRLPNDPTKTRIRAILDQTQSPPVTFNKAQIEAAIATDTQIIQPGAMVGGTRVETDTNDHKHGTHVAGIAAGNGKKAGNCSGEFKYVGVAPEAELVIVKFDFGGGAAGLLSAIQFISATAAAVPVSGIPAVVNMSLGHSSGPHDGTDPMDRMIDNFLVAHAAGPFSPVVLVASSGNSGGHSMPGPPKVAGDDSHATGVIPPGGAVKPLRFNVYAEKAVKGQVTTSVEIRFTAPNGVGCQLIPPGNNISGGSNLAPPDGVASFTEVTQNSTCSVIGAGAAGSHSITLTIQSAANGKNQPGDWTINFTNAGAAAITYHAWLHGDQFERLMDDLSQANTVGSPGSSTGIITVGNYASSGKSKGELADSSSRGPRVDGVQKPDVSAPGEEICSAKRDLHVGCCCDCCCDSYIDMSGTSMAAPHVTGAIALMLERNPALTHQQIKNILLANARRDAFTGTAPNSNFGNGKLDVLALLNDPIVRGTGAVISAALAATHASTPNVNRIAGLPPHLPEIPHLQEGTPLFRLLQTAEGQRLYQLGLLHWEEVRGLVNTQKRVALVWHRNHGPFLLHHVTRTTMLPHVPLPREIDGIELSVRAANMVSALEPYSSRELIQAMHETLPIIARLQGKTLLELVEMFEVNEELQHA